MICPCTRRPLYDAFLIPRPPCTTCPLYEAPLLWSTPCAMSTVYNVSLARFVPITMCLLYNAFLVRCAPCLMYDSSLVQCVPCTMRLLDDVSLGWWFPRKVVPKTMNTLRDRCCMFSPFVPSVPGTILPVSFQSFLYCAVRAVWAKSF
jgi:hypothetical protein